MGQEMEIAMETHHSAFHLCLNFDTRLKLPGLTFIIGNDWEGLATVSSLYSLEYLLCLFKTGKNFHL